jgi:hypothetical protein
MTIDRDLAAIRCHSFFKHRRLRNVLFSSFYRLVLFCGGFVFDLDGLIGDKPWRFIQAFVVRATPPGSFRNAIKS